MPFKLIGFLIVLLVAIFFIGFNLDNRCDVSVVLHTFEDVPIVLSLLAAYVLGSFSVIPFLLGRRRKKNSAVKKETGKNEMKQKEHKKDRAQQSDSKNTFGTL